MDEEQPVSPAGKHVSFSVILIPFFYHENNTFNLTGRLIELCKIFTKC